VRLREARRREEEDQRLPSSLYEEVRQRNRLDRLRRACREQIASSSTDLTSGDPELARLVEAGPLSASDTLEAAIYDPDPLPYDLRSRIETARSQLYSSHPY